ncbi:VOC family protein [Amycolatopsis sp. RM579]|uniref:VOC family protein n=2 Tax=Amycolatopsis pithecellobii TaxID=664692 RepID=A0A6N7YJL8_9PSEU|nr:VOC family protein [Amycolatopsis pithecellobii]
MIDAPVLDGVHHLKLPVADLDRTQAWYSSRLGYRPVIRFTKHGRATGLVMAHPHGGPMLGFVLDPERAARASGFDYFSIGVPDKDGIDQLAERLTTFGERHAGVHFATIGWILPETHDPDGHEVRFYTTGHHTDLTGDEVIVVEDPVGTEAQREEAHRARANGDV